MVAFNNGIQRRRVSHQKGTQPSTRVGKIRQDCEDRVAYPGQGGVIKAAGIQILSR